MAFYDLNKDERSKLVDKINYAIGADIEKGSSKTSLTIHPMRILISGKLLT
jgi:hypothetical protein